MADDRDPGTPLNPVRGAERIASIDVLRGFALLGILVMNIPTFAYIEAAWMNPTVQGTDGPLDRGAWLFSHLFFDLKMMAIFSMLFGAGIVMMRSRASAVGRGPGLHYRRMAWLLVIGLAHAYLVWEGDILVAYALCGMIFFWLSRLRARWLIPLGLVLMLGAPAINVSYGFMLEEARERWTQAQSLPDGAEPNKADEGWILFYESALDEHNPDAETRAERAATFTGGYLDRLRPRAISAAMWQTFLFAMWGVWRIGGLMLVGMGLYKLGVFSAARSARAYALMLIAGYGLGLPIVWYGAQAAMAREFDFVYMFQTGWWFNYGASLLVAMGHIALVMLVCRLGLLGGVRRSLSAVGRMALSNYLAQSVLCALLFYGYGFGLWGRLGRFELLGVVAMIWIAQLVWSPLWLSRYRFGPVEWLWRSLTYWKRQPMSRSPGPDQAVASS